MSLRLILLLHPVATLNRVASLALHLIDVSHRAHFFGWLLRSTVTSTSISHRITSKHISYYLIVVLFWFN
jgi:hypothetical protein